MLVVIYYAANCMPTGDRSSGNEIDSSLIHYTSRLPVLRTLNKHSRRWEPLLRQAVLMYSDQQLITGVAVLISALTQLNSGLSSFHWQIAVYLAWFSSMTHLGTLTSLRYHFHCNTRARNLRVILMTLNLALLITALIPTGNYYWLENRLGSFYGFLPAICFFDFSKHRFDVQGSQGMTLTVSLVVLCFNFLTRALKLSKYVSARTSKWFRIRPGARSYRWLDNRSHDLQSSNTHKATTLIYCMSCTIILIYMAMYEILVSTLWEVKSPYSLTSSLGTV